MKQLIEQQNKKLKQTLIDDFIANHQKFELSISRNYYWRFHFTTKTGWRKTKTVFFIEISIDIDDLYYGYSTRTFSIRLHSTITDPVDDGYIKLHQFYPAFDSNRMLLKDSVSDVRYTHQNATELEKILIGYVNEHIKKVYATKLDEVNGKFTEIEKTLSKLKDKIQKRETVDIVKYQHTFDEFKKNLEEFETYLNVIKK